MNTVHGQTGQQFSDVTFCETGATEKFCCLCCDFVWVSIVMQFWNAEDLLTHALQEKTDNGFRKSLCCH